MIKRRLRTQVHSPSLRFLLRRTLRATVLAGVNTGEQRQNTSGGWEGSVFDALPSLVEGCGSLQKKVR